MPNPNTICPDPKLSHLCSFSRTQRKQSREDSLQRTTIQPAVLPKRNFPSITNFPLKNIFKTPSPTLQSPHLLQIFPPKKAPTIFPILSKTSPTSIFRFKNLLSQTTLIRPSLQIHFPSKAKLKILRSITPRPPISRGSQIFFQEPQAIFLPSEPQPQRKFLRILTNLSATTKDILNKDIKNNGD